MAENEDKIEFTLTWKDAVLKIALPVGLVILIVQAILSKAL